MYYSWSFSVSLKLKIKKLQKKKNRAPLKSFFASAFASVQRIDKKVPAPQASKQTPDQPGTWWASGKGGCPEAGLSLL